MYCSAFDLFSTEHRLLSDLTSLVVLTASILVAYFAQTSDEELRSARPHHFALLPSDLDSYSLSTVIQARSTPYRHHATDRSPRAADFLCRLLRHFHDY